MQPFRFKQFEIKQDNCAMKVGTDGVLLGAWVPVQDSVESILDIGAGTGLIALMLAQRSTAETIDAIELDDDAYEQCVDNFETSPWGDRLFCYHAHLWEFVQEMEEGYDLIVSNPPFYSENVSSGDTSRDQARQNQSMPYELLLLAVQRFLNPGGRFALILPYAQETSFCRLAGEFGLFPLEVLRVRGNPESPLKRSCCLFSRDRVEDVLVEELTIEVERHQYTKAYRNLTRDFYLKM